MAKVRYTKKEAKLIQNFIDHYNRGHDDYVTVNIQTQTKRDWCNGAENFLRFRTKEK